MATPSATARPLTGDVFIDAATHGYSWQLDSSRTIKWGLSNGFAGEFWNSPAAVSSVLGSVFATISYYTNVNFSYVGYFNNPSIAAANGVDISISPAGSSVFGSNTSTWAIGLFPNAVYNSTLYQGAPGDIFLNINSAANFLPTYAPGSAGYSLAIHEIGHALGLK